MRLGIRDTRITNQYTAETLQAFKVIELVSDCLVRSYRILWVLFMIGFWQVFPSEIVQCQGRTKVETW